MNLEEKARAVSAQMQVVKAELELVREQTTDLVWALTDQGYSVRDIAPLLHISPGRVSQIKKENPR